MGSSPPVAPSSACLKIKGSRPKNPRFRPPKLQTNGKFWDADIDPRTTAVLAESDLLEFSAFVAIVPSLHRPSEAINALPLPHLQGWLAGHLASGLFETIMVRPTTWSPDDVPLAAALPQYIPGDERA